MRQSKIFTQKLKESLTNISHSSFPVSSQNLSPMITENLQVEKKLLSNNEIKKCLNKIIKTKSLDDKIIIRPSGTEDLIRVSVSMKNKDDIDSTLKNIKDCIIGGL